MLRKWDKEKIKSVIVEAALFYFDRKVGRRPPTGMFTGQGKHWDPDNDERCPNCCKMYSGSRYKHAYSMQHVVCSRRFGISSKIYRQHKEDIECIMLSLILEHELKAGDK